MKNSLARFAVILATFAVAQAAVFEGPGPDPGGDGGSLVVQFKDDKATFLENATFNADKTYVMRFRAGAKGDWDVVILVYSAHGSEQTPPVKDKLLATYKFKNTDAAKADKATTELDRDKIDWRAEPGRLVKYYRAHKADFTKAPDDYDPSKAKDE